MIYVSYEQNGKKHKATLVNPKEYDNLSLDSSITNLIVHPTKNHLNQYNFNEKENIFGSKKMLLG